jgi:malonate transporter and related proteins
MLNTILGALLPMVVTFLLGFVAAWHHDFATKDASVLNRMVLVYAVPLALFAGTVSTPRAALTQEIPLVIALCIAIIGLYTAIFLLSRFAFRAGLGISALAALMASAPAVPFVGPAVLGNLFGRLSAIPIAIGSLVINLTVVPVTILLLTLDTPGEDLQAKNPAAHDGEHSAPSHLSILAAKLGETVKEPLVWAPVLAFVVVLTGTHVPKAIVQSFAMLGYASGGVALFASGIVLASGKIKADWFVLIFVVLKNIVQPALVLGGLRWFGYSDPILNEAVLTVAIPTMPIVTMLALQYQVAQAEAASTVFLSVIGSVITMGVFIALTH